MPSGLGGGNRWGGGKTPTTTKQGSGLGGSTSSAPVGAGSGLGSGDRWGGSKSSAPAAPTAAKKPSLLGQVTNIVAKLPSGAYHAAQQGITHDSKWIALGALPGSPTFNPMALRKLVGATKPTPDRTRAQGLETELPFLGGMAQSFGRTAGDVRHPSHFVQASREGTIVSKVLEDAANASIALGPLSKSVGAAAAGAREASDVAAQQAAREGATEAAQQAAAQAARRAARLTAAERVTSGAEKVAARTASAPVYPYQVAGRLLGRGVAPAAEALGKTGLGERVGEAIANRTAARAEKVQFKGAIDEANQRAGDLQSRIAQHSQDVEKLLPHPDQQAALTLIERGEFKPLKGALAQLPEDQHAAFLKQTFIDAPGRDPLYKPTAEALAIARDYTMGKMDPELAAKFDQAIKGDTANLYKPRQARALAGEGFPEGRKEALGYPGINPQQAGYEPLSAPVDAAAEKAMKNLPRAVRESGRAAARAQREAARFDVARADESAALEAKAQAAGDTKLASQRRTLEGAVTRQEGRAVTAADRLTSLRDLQEAAKVQPPRVSTLPKLQLAAGRAVTANERAATAFDRGLSSTTQRQASAEAAAGRLGKVAEGEATAGRKEGARIGAVAEQARQGARLSSLEGRRLTTLRTKLEGLPDEATPASVAPTFGTGKRLGQLETRARVTQHLAESADTRVARIRANVQKSAARTADSVGAAPARLRPMLTAGRRGVHALQDLADQAEAAAPGSGAIFAKAAAEIPTSLKHLETAGLDAPHVIGGKVPERPSLFGGTRQPKMRKLAAQTQRETNITPLTVRGRAILESTEVRKTVTNEFAKDVEKRFTSAAADHGVTGLTGGALVKAMEAQDMVPWSAKTGLKGVADEAVTPQTRFISKTLRDEFQKYMGPPGKVEQAFRTYYDRPLKVLFKDPVLALSPRWHLGNMLTNTTMAVTGAGIDPIELAQRMGEARKMLKENPDALPSRLKGKGMSMEASSYLSGNGRAPRTAYGRLIEKSYRLNGTVDDLYHSAIYLAKKARGFSDEEAITQALKVAGDMSTMSPFERQVVRRALPFWAWTKHITTLALKMPAEHPLRTAWILHMADLYGDDQTNLPSYLKGSIDMGGGRYLNLTRLTNPFGDVNGSPLLSPQGFLQSLTPAAKVGAAIGFGTSVTNKGIKPLTRPANTGNFDENRNPTVTPLATRPKEAGYFLGRILPQTRALQDSLGKPAVRDETGHPYVNDAGPIAKDNAGRKQALAGLLGIPLPQKYDAAAQQAKVAKKRATAEKQQQNYEKKRKAGG